MSINATTTDDICYGSEVQPRKAFPQFLPRRRSDSFFGTISDKTLEPLEPLYGVALSGAPVTLANINRAREIDRITTLISKFVHSGLSWDGRNSSRVSMDTGTAAICLLYALGMKKRLPKIAPDGEGGLDLLWDGDSPVLIVVDGWKLHVVFNAATPQATYLDGVPFNGLSIPDFISKAIPTM